MCALGPLRVSRWAWRWAPGAVCEWFLSRLVRGVLPQSLAPLLPALERLPRVLVVLSAWYDVVRGRRVDGPSVAPSIWTPAPTPPQSRSPPRTIFSLRIWPTPNYAPAPESFCPTPIWFHPWLNPAPDAGCLNPVLNRDRAALWNH